jgi:hypothetical protein
VLLLCIVALGALGVGRLGVVRADAQRASDAAALVAVDVIRQRGLPFDDRAQRAAETVARRNSPLPMTFTWDVQQSDNSLRVGVKTSIRVDLPTLVWPSGGETVEGEAIAEIRQVRLTTAERRLAKFVLAVDYSATTKLPFSQDTVKSTNSVIEESIRGLLGNNLEVDYGAVFFVESVSRTVPIDQASPQNIRDATAAAAPGAGQYSNYAAAIDAATALLRNQPDYGYYVLLLSDGVSEPNRKILAQQAATRAWDSKVTLFTFEIRNQSSLPSGSDPFMTSIAGSPEVRADRNKHYVATTVNSLRELFTACPPNPQKPCVDIQPKCVAGPINPAPTDIASIRVYLEKNRQERAIALVSDDELKDRNAGEGFQYRESDARLLLTRSACAAVIEDGAQILVRYDGGNIIQ